MPATNAWSISYTAHTTVSVINFSGISNGSCTYSLSLLNSSGLTAADTTIFTVTQPTFTSISGAIDPRIVTDTTNGKL